MKVYKSNIKFTDSYDNPLEVKEGYWLRNLLKENKIWPEDKIRAAFNRFKESDFGEISEFEEKRNNRHIENNKGTIVGVYPKDDDEYNDLIISYDPRTDVVHLLSRWEYESHPISWEGKVERNGRVLYDPEKDDPRGEKNYDEPDRQLNKSQRRQFMAQLEKLPNQAEEAESANKYIGVVTPDQMKAVALAVEGKGRADVPADFKEKLEKLAADHNVEYEDIIEKLAERVYVHNDSLYPRAYNNLLKVIDKPYFFSDNKSVEDNVIKINEDGEAIALVIVKDGIFETTPESDIKLAGKVHPRGLWKNFADDVECEKEDIKVEYIGSYDEEDYYKVICKFNKDELVEDSKVNDIFEPISSFKEFKFMDKTRQGFEIIHAYEDLDDNRMHVIVYRPNMDDYVIGLGYSPEDGTWNQGVYDLKSATDAEEVLKENYKVKLYNHDEEIKEDVEDINIDDVYIEDEEVEEEMITCECCDEEYPASELRMEKHLGMMCPHCIEVLKARGEKLYLDKAMKAKDGFNRLEMEEMYDLAKKLGLKTQADLDKFALEHGKAKDKELLEALRKEANKLVEDAKVIKISLVPNEEDDVRDLQKVFDNEFLDYLVDQGIIEEEQKPLFKSEISPQGNLMAKFPEGMQYRIKNALSKFFEGNRVNNYEGYAIKPLTIAKRILNMYRTINADEEEVQEYYNYYKDIFEEMSKSKEIRPDTPDKLIELKFRRMAEEAANNGLLGDSENRFYLGFEAEDNFDGIDSTELDERIVVNNFKGDITDDVKVRIALEKAARQALEIREVEGEIDLSEMIPGDLYRIKFNKIWVEDEDGNHVGEDYTPAAITKKFK